MQSTGRYFRYFEHNFRFPDLVGDGVGYMNGIQADSKTTCPPAFNSTESTFGNSVRECLPEDTEVGDADKIVKGAETIVVDQEKFERTEAAAVASDGADAIEAFLSACPDGDVSVCSSFSFCAPLDFVPAIDALKYVHHVPDSYKSYLWLLKCDE